MPEVIPPQKKPRRKWLRRLAYVLAFLVLLVGAGIAVLQTDWARSRIKTYVEDLAAASLNDGRLTIGQLRGNLLFSASATNVRLFSGDSIVVAVDSLDAGYDLLSLLSDNIRLTAIDVRHAQLTARQDADSTWDFVRLFASETAPSSQAPPPGVRIDDLSIRDGQIAVRFHTTAGDSVIAAPEVDVVAQDLYFEGGQFGATLDMLRATVTAPVAPDPVRIAASGEVTDGRFVCSLCRLESPRSSVSARGHLSYDRESIYGDMLLQIDSLMLGDVAFALPSVDPDEVLRGSASVSGSRDTLSANVDVTTSSGAYAKLEALIVQSSPARFRINGAIQGLDPSTFLAGLDLAGTVNADVDVDLLGDDLASVTGPVELRIFDTVLNGVDLNDGFLQGHVDDGRAQFDARFFLPGVEIRGKGSATPFADTIAYDFSGVLQGTKLSSRYESLESVDNAAARFEVAGRGLDLESAVVSASIDLSRLDGPSFDLRDGSLRLQARSGHIVADATVGLHNLGDGSPAGRATLSVEADRIDDGWQLEVKSAAADSISPQALATDAMTGSISGRGSGTATWRSGRIEQATGAVNLDGFLERFVFSDLTGEIGFEDGAGSYSLTGSSNVGEATMRGRITSQDTEYGLTAVGRIRNADVDTLFPARMATDLNGLINATARFGQRGLRSLQAEIRLDASRVNDQRIESALLNTHLADSLLTFDFDVDLPNGSVAGEGTMRPFSDAPVIVLDAGSFAHLNVGAWLDSDLLASDLNGAVKARVNGTDVEASFEIDPSRLNLERIRHGRAELTSSDSTFVVTTEIVTSDGSARGAISGQFGADTTYQGLISFRDLDVAALAGRDSLETAINAGCSFFGKGFSLPRLELSSLCTGRNSRIGGARIDTLRFEAGLDTSALSLTSFTMRSNVGSFSGSGSIPTHEQDVRSSRTINLNFDIADLNPAAALVGARKLNGDGTIVVSLGGSVESPSLNVDADLEYLEFDAYRVSSITGFLTIPDDPNDNILAAVDIGYSVLNDVAIQRTTMEMEKSGSSILLTSDFRIDARRRGNLSARYDIREGDDLVVVDAVNLNLDSERWALSEPAEFEIGDRWSVRTFLLFSNDQQIALDGYLDPDGEQNLIVTLEQIRLGAFSDLVGYPGLDGVGEGYVVLAGPHDALELQSNINVRSVQTYGRDVGNFRLDADYQGERMQIDSRLFHTIGDTLTIRGFVPLRLSMSGLESLRGDEEVSLEVQADSLPMGWIRPFLDQSLVDRVDGFLVSDVRIGGTWGEPELSGAGRLIKGRIRLPQFKLDMRPVDGRFRLDGDRLIIEEAVASSKTGTIDLAGSVGFRSLDDPTFDVDATFKEFRSINTETYQITVSGSGRLTGSLIKPEFKGKVSMDDSEIFMTEELMADEVDPVRLSERDLRIVERRFGYRAAAGDTTAWDFYDALKLDLDASIGRNVWVRSYLNPRMDVEFGGDLSITKLPLQDEIVTGTIRVNSSRSRVVIFGRRFDITTGEIQFNDVIDEALVDLNARYSVPSHFGGNEVQINLAITGSVGDMRMSLTSDPPMDTGEMASYLATGRPPGEGSVGGTQAAELAVNSLGGLVEGFANQELGLDVVEIQASPTRGTYLTVGKYLSPRVYASFTQPIITNDSYGVGDATHQTEVAIEYELVSWLLAKVKPSRNQIAVNLIWEFAF